MSILARTARPARALTLRVLGTCLVASLALGACARHGKHTTAQINLATQRMAELKSATEYQMANQAFLAGDLDKALKHVNFSLELNPGIAKTHVLKGRVLLEMSKIEESSASLQQAASIDASNVDAAYYQGLLAERIDRKEEALAHYTRANELDATNPQYAIAAAEMLVALGRSDEAHAFLTDRREQFDHSAGVRQTLGHIALLRNDATTAARLFSEARLLAPDDTSIVEDLIRAQIATGDFGQAEFNLARLLAAPRNKDRRDLLQMRARCLVQIERPVEARDILLALTRDDAAAADPQTWIFLGQTAVALRDMPRVRLASTRAIALAPRNADGYVLRAIYQKNSGNPEAAEATLQEAVRLNPTCENLILLGLTQQELGKATDAAATFKAAAAADPTDPRAEKLLAAFGSQDVTP
ncbi:MAG: hypothetical protein DYG92_11820 [Leptolyngbya sp. PLA1]|nr:hypothetical protein [Leptolyngbya sp. PLA1]